MTVVEGNKPDAGPPGQGGRDPDHDLALARDRRRLLLDPHDLGLPVFQDDDGSHARPDSGGGCQSEALTAATAYAGAAAGPSARRKAKSLAM